jgi:hypothetical protein
MRGEGDVGAAGGALFAEADGEEDLVAQGFEEARVARPADRRAGLGGAAEGFGAAAEVVLVAQHRLTDEMSEVGGSHRGDSTRFGAARPLRGVTS